MTCCAWPGCGQQVKYPRLLCIEHWGQVPPRVQAAVRRHLTNSNHDSARVTLRDYLGTTERQA